MNTPTPAPYRNTAATPEVEVAIEWSPDRDSDPEDDSGADDSGALPVARLFLHGQPVETRRLRGGARILAQALVNLVLADYRRRPSDDPGPGAAPWN